MSRLALKWSAPTTGDVSGTPRLLDALRGVGFGETELAAVGWDNWRRVLGAWWRD